MEGHHWQAHRLSPTYAAASTMTGDMSITHHVGPRLQQGWPVSRPPSPVPLQSRGGGTSATLLDIPERLPRLTCVRRRPPRSPLFAHPTVVSHCNGWEDLISPEKWRITHRKIGTHLSFPVPWHFDMAGTRGTTQRRRRRWKEKKREVIERPHPHIYRP